MFWLQLMKSFNIALCSNNKKKSHLASLGPGHISSSKGRNDLMQFLDQKGCCSLYVTGCGWGLLREWDRCWHNTSVTSSAPRCALGPQNCPSSGPQRIWMLSRRLPLSTLCISPIWKCEHLRKAHRGWPAMLHVAGRVPEFCLRFGTLGKRFADDFGSLYWGGEQGDMCPMKPGNKSKERATWINGKNAKMTQLLK